MNQLALPLAALVRHATYEDVAALIEWLAGRGWVLAREITAAFPKWDDRSIRELASQSRGRIVSGNKGYKLTIECVPEEIDVAASRLWSQGREMMQRSIDIRNYWHKSASRRRS